MPASTNLPPFVGERAPGFTLRDRTGRAFRFNPPPGKPILLIFWAFWCDTWKAVARALRQARLRPPYWDGDVWAICTDGRWVHRLSADPIARLVDFPVLLDIGSQVSRRYAVDAVPTLVLIDHAGVVRWRLRGVPKPAWLESAVSSLSAPVHMPESPLYLTFDDFPQPGDDRLLKVLRELNLRVALFAIGRNAERLSRLVQLAMEDGHCIGNHSYSHVPLAEMDTAQWTADFERANRVLHRLTGQRPHLLRLPGNPNAPLATEIASALSMQAVGYTVNPYDFARPGERMLLERVLAQAKPGGIVLLHCGVHETVQALPVLVQSLSRRFTLRPLDVGGTDNDTR